MAWETRANRRYYYRSLRLPGGRVVKEYFGCGASALRAAAEDDRKRKREQTIRDQLTTERQRTAAAEQLVTELHHESTALFTAALLAAGYHRLNYGPWRRSRTMIASNLEPQRETQHPEKMTDKEARARIRELAAKAQAGELTAVVEIRQLLADHPELFRRLGDLASHAQRAWINVIAGDNVELREMLIRKVGDLKRQLGAESADTAVAGLVADQVVSSWLALYYAELAESQSSPSSLKWAEFQLKRLESAHRRHLKSLAALAVFQRTFPRPQDTVTVADRDQSDAAHCVSKSDLESSRLQLCFS